MRGLERHGCFALATGADGLGFHSLVVAAVLRQAQRLGAFPLAVFAAFGFVFELFIVEEKLFTSGEYEVSAAVHTLENFILEVHLRVPLSCIHAQESGQSTQVTQWKSQK